MEGDGTRQRQASLPRALLEFLLKSNLVVTTLFNVVLARSLSSPSTFTFLLAWPASELSPGKRAR